MSTRMLRLCLAVLALAVGCGCELSFDFTIAGFYHPAYNPEAVVADQNILGLWQDVSSEDFGFVEFEPEDDGLMDMTMLIKKDDHKVELHFQAALFVSGGVTYLDATPYALEDDEHTVFRSLMTVTTHGVFRVLQVPGGYDLHLLDPLALAATLEDHPEVLAHMSRGEDDPYILITASTHEIQAFLAGADLGENPYMELFKLRRPQNN